MSSYNKVILMGNLTRDPDVRSLPSGQAVTELGLATNRKYRKGGEGGEVCEETTFVDVTAWGRTGEVIAQHFHRGDGIHVEGRLQFRSWEDKDGNKRSKLSVVLESFEFLPGGKGGQGAQGGPQGRAAPSSAAPRGAAPAGHDGFDEVPF